MRYTGLSKIISGGQTGADQGGLLAAHHHGVMTGGTAPMGFMTSRGPNLLLFAFGLRDKGTLQTRTKQNIVDSDGTVVLSADMKSSGTQLTLRLARELNKPVHVIDIGSAMATFGDTGGLPIDELDDVCNALCLFLTTNAVRTLNVAGNRERFEDSRTTFTTKIIVSRTLQILDLDNLLIRDTDL